MLVLFSIEIACAIPGIDSPCCAVVAFVNAPVAISNILFSFFCFNCLNKYPEKIVAQHAHP